MATEEQVRANRENAQKSTGPKSPEGKARSSRNAITHGLTSHDLVTFGENPEELDAFREAWMAELAPEGVEEQDLADRVVDSAWRLRRAGRMERRLTWLHYIDNYSDKVKLDELNAERLLVFSDNMSAELIGNGRSILNLDRHEAHIERLYYKAMDRLKKLRAERTEDRRQTADDGRGKANAEGRRPNTPCEEKRTAAGSDSAKRSQSGAETQVEQGQAEFLRARAAEEAASIGSAISGEQAGACGRGGAKTDAERPRQGIAPQSGVTRGKEQGDDAAKRSQLGAAVPGREIAGSAPRPMAQALS